MARRQNLNPKTIQQPNKWSISNLPPKGNYDVGAFFYGLCQVAVMERQRLGLKERWLNCYKMFRGNHFNNNPLLSAIRGKKSKLSLSLLTANIQRTVANITAREPQAHVKSVHGLGSQFEDVLTQKLKLWSNSEDQQQALGTSVYNQEIYGVTIEKAVYHRDAKTADSVVLDPFAYLQAPGNYKEPNDAPYVAHMYTMDIDACADKFNVPKDDISEEDTYSLLGSEREEERIIPKGTNEKSINAEGNYLPTSHPNQGEGARYSNRCLIFEVWVRDYSTYIDFQYEDGGIDPDTEEQILIAKEVKKYVYPGNIRVVTLTNQGWLVLSDTMNPNINPNLPVDLVQNTYLYNRFPFYKSVSYEDPASPWGFSQTDMVGDINLAIDDLWSIITSYLRMTLHPPLILPKDTGISKSQVRYTPRLVLQPNSYQTSLGIRWLEMPTPPAWLFEALNTLLTFFDRISQIEDAERGQQPGGVIAASAIQMLQERSTVLLRAKIRGVDHLVRERGRCFISFYQNFGVDHDNIEVNDTTYTIRGIDVIQHQFNYLVESGSTVAKTESQEQQQAVQMYQLGAIDRQALLEAVNFRNWKEVVERMGENDLDMALNVLVKSGLPEQTATYLKQQLIQSQGGPGNTTQGGSQGQSQGGSINGPGAPAGATKPKAEQGQQGQ